MKFIALLLAALFAASPLTAQEPANSPVAPAAETAPAPSTVPALPNTNLAVPPLSLTPEDPPKPTEPPKPSLSEEEPLLPVPAGPILDQAGVLRPDAVGRLTAALTAARTKDVWVYVLTVPSLRVLPSKQKEKLEGLAKRYAKAWLPDSAGAILLFDDEGGLMFLETSGEATRRFSDVSIQIALEQRMAKISTDGLAREKLENMAFSAAEALTELQTQYAAEATSHRKTNLLMGGLALVGAGLAIWSAISGQKAAPPLKEEAESQAPPPGAV